MSRAPEQLTMSSVEATPKTAGPLGALALARGSASALWNHMAETHRLHLLASEESDIRHAANAGAEEEIRRLKNEVWALVAELKTCMDLQHAQGFPCIPAERLLASYGVLPNAEVSNGHKENQKPL